MTTVEKVFQDAIGWLAAEHSYFMDLKRDLEHLKEDLEEAKIKNQVNDVKKCFKDFRYLAISEARFNRQEHHSEEILKRLRTKRITLYGSIAEIDDLLKRLHTEAAQLIHDSSLYEGKIRDLLLHLQLNVQENQTGQAQAVLMELAGFIEEAEKWLAAVSVDLSEAKRIVGELEGRRDEMKEELVIDKCKKMYELNYKSADLSQSIRKDYLILIIAHYHPKTDNMERWNLLSTSHHMPERLKAEVQLKISQMIEGYQKIGVLAAEIEKMEKYFPLQRTTIKEAVDIILKKTNRLIERYQKGDYRDEEMISGTLVIMNESLDVAPIIIRKKIVEIAAGFNFDLMEWWLSKS